MVLMTLVVDLEDDIALGTLDEDVLTWKTVIAEVDEGGEETTLGLAADGTRLEEIVCGE